VLFKLSHYSFVHTNSQEELMGKKFKLNIWRKHMWGFFFCILLLYFFFVGVEANFHFHQNQTGFLPPIYLFLMIKKI